MFLQLYTMVKALPLLQHKKNYNRLILKQKQNV